MSRATLTKRLRKNAVILTPDDRRDIQKRAIGNIKQRWPKHACEFPWSFAKELFLAIGVPHEVVRWLNRNDHKPAAKIKRIVSRVLDAWNETKVFVYVLFKPFHKIEGLAGEDELRSFIASTRRWVNKKTGFEAMKKGRWWFATPGDNIVNRYVIAPGENGNFLSGAVVLRFDEDFFMFAAFPYRFRDIPITSFLKMMFPETDLSEYEILPDSGSPEMEKYIKDKIQSSKAAKMVLSLHPKANWDRIITFINPNDTITVSMTRDNIVVVSETFTRTQIEAPKR